MEKTVIELFAGVGGFRVGLNDVQLVDGKVIENRNWKFVWANQWEPSTKTQPAFDCYTKRFGESPSHVNEDITIIKAKDIPPHSLLVGGFPCQDYSVARSLSREKGITGKKGVLWWEIHKILKSHKTPFVLLENVDRLLKSPSSQRGRDFGIMLKSLDDLGYGVEWRVINAAEYGAAQRRRRVFIFAYHKKTKHYKTVKNLDKQLYSKGLFAKTFPVKDTPNKKRRDVSDFTSFNDLLDVSDNFDYHFWNCGIMHKGKFLTIDTLPLNANPTPLKDILEKRVTDDSFYFTKEQKVKHKYLKGSKRIARIRPNGEPYNYTEGSMTIPENLDLPGRTMLTSEGTSNRSTHVIKDLSSKRWRKITPVEAERLNNFPDNWTNTGMSTRQRYFMMGNALVTSIVNKLEDNLSKME